MAASYGSVEASELRGSTRTPASTGRFDRVVPRAATQIAQFGRWQGPANPHRLAVLIRARPRSVHSSTGAPTPPNPRSPHARPGLHQRPRGPPGPPTPPDPTTASRRHPAPGKPHERAYAGTSPWPLLHDHELLDTAMITEVTGLLRQRPARPLPGQLRRASLPPG